MIFCFFQFIVLLILVLVTSTFEYYAFANNVTDQQALFSVKDSITSDPLGVLSSWNNSIHFCQWKGVTCSRRRQRVTALDLSSQQLTGTLSSHIGNLSFLRAIDLNENDFHGAIPNEIGRLFRLQYLALANNSFQGRFPANLSYCTDIRNISMFGNTLVGKLPTELASWSKLVLFNLGNNNFSGSVPPSIGNISSLRRFDLRRNNLVGEIPLEVAHLTKLEILVLSINSFRGMVPLLIYNISSLYQLAFEMNELEGMLPAGMGLTLPKLQKFNAGMNRFIGPLPPSITNATNLVILDIAMNNITGPVPMNFGRLSSLEALNLGVNPLGDNQAPDGLSFFNSLANCTSLAKLGLFYNGLRGQLPNSIVNLSATIEVLDMFQNQIYGSIPQDIGKLSNLKRLALNNNFLTGKIPESIGELSKLGKIYLVNNDISGVIPISISNLTQLGLLSVDNNMLRGSIPIGLFNISTLQALFLSNNSLGGVIPEQIVGLSSHCVYLYLDQNLFTGPLPSSFGSFKQLVQLDVSNNKLTGDIPATLGDCVMLEELDIGSNFFEGKIPPSFKKLKSLVYLDLSMNNLSGSIPSFFNEYRLIEFLNLSHNKLEGEVSKEGLFSNASRFSVVGNLQLCGGLQALQLSDCPVKLSGYKKKTFPLKFVLLLVFLPLSMLLACLAFIFHRHQKSKQVNVPVLVSQGNQYPRLSYQDLLLATDEFSPNNLLGEGRYGSVYRGLLESPDQTIAVKVLNVEVRGANKSFLAECETLRNIRHRNLIKIITACSSTDYKGNDFKALVFEFMTNGSLDNWLHPSPSDQVTERNLSLLQRLDISIDVALGVDYLHHHSHASIIHCDIKPSNILLDEDFVARVGDFGLAKFSFPTKSDINETQYSSIGVCGTVGYVPPEYGMGSGVSAEGDVYSYGILLLEIFSGKRPTSNSVLIDNADNLHDYAKKALPHRVMDIADPRIIVEDARSNRNQSYSRAAVEVCLSSIFEVGILCSVETPKERMEMSVAIKQLHAARDKFLSQQAVTFT